MIYCTVTILAILRYVKSAAGSIMGHICSFAECSLLCFCLVPFGYGYSIDLVAFGYSLGWIALISIVVGGVPRNISGISVDEILPQGMEQTKV